MEKQSSAQAAPFQGSCLPDNLTQIGIPKPIQFSLLPEAGSRNVAVRNADPQKKFQGTSEPAHWLVLEALMRRPMPLAQLERMTKIKDVMKVVGELRGLGLAILSHQVTAMGLDNIPVSVEVHAMTKGDIRAVGRALMSARRKSCAPATIQEVL